MLPLINSGTYETHQHIDWEVAWWDSSTGVPETGIGFKIGTIASTFTTAGMQGAADPEVYMEANSTPVFTDGGGAWKLGRDPLVHSFWEAGAPPGVTVAGGAVLHWQGDVASGNSWISDSEDFFLSFAGNGHVLVEKDGVQILDSEIEPDAVVVTPLINSGSVSPTIDIYYWQANKAWGGVVGKYVPKISDTHLTVSTLQHREAPVISASLLPKSTAARVVLAQITDAKLSSRSPTDFTDLKFTLSLKDPNTTIGWELLSAPRRLLYDDGVSPIVLKRGHLIELRAGFKDELYNRFRGFIHDFEESKGIITVTCRSIEAKMASTQVENYPDRLSYANFGYFKRTGTSEPIFNIAAYDFWPMEYAIQDLCYKAGLDSKLFYGRRQFTDSVGTLFDKTDKYHIREIFDTFTDTDTTTLESHTLDTAQAWDADKDTFTIVSNKGQLINDTDQAFVTLSVSDQYTLQADFSFSTGSTGSVELTFRGSSTLGSNYLGYRLKATRTSTTLVDIVLEYEDTGGPTTIATVTGQSWATGVTKKLIVEVDGINITCYIAENTNASKTKLFSGIGLKQRDSARVGLGMTAISGQTNTVDDFEAYVWKDSKVFQARSLSNVLVRLQRQAEYGNAGGGFTETQAVDVEYIYKPSVSRSVLEWAKELADGFAYDFRANAAGDLVLTTRNNPHRSFNITGGTDTFDSDSYGGFYQKYTSSVSYNRVVVGSRIDLVAAGKDTLGIIDYTVKKLSDFSIVAQGTVDLNITGETSGLLLYDNRFTVDGSNVVVTKLFSGDWDEYLVELTDNSGTEWWLDALFVYDHDNEATALAETLLTSKSIITLSTSSQGEESRNYVVVIGKRKSALTDSAKTKNPNNPDHEFFVSVGSDPSSIWDNAADNYIGSKIATVIVDKKVADQDYADWLAQTLLTRQRDPGPSTQFTHPVIPVIESRDHIRVSDEKFSSIVDSDELWVISYSEDYSIKKATSQIQTTAYKEVPSYEPREDLSLALIDSTFDGNPAINVQITYPSLDDTKTITNAIGGLPAVFVEKASQTLTIATDGNGEYVDLSDVTSTKWSGHVWPPVPDSIAISSDGGGSTGLQALLKNTPYTKFWHIYDYTTTKLHLPFLAGDGNVNYTRDSGDGWNTGSSTQVTVTYQGLASGVPQIYSGESPFYDPYTSELPDAGLVTIQFDSLISGFYRVSVWDKRHDSTDPTPIAWLTEPGVDGDKADAHWSYLTAGSTKIFKWDGVDNIGRWNAKQSEHFAWVARGVFDLDKKLGIGKGFYAWNDQTTPLVAISDQKTSGKLTFNDEHYSQFYVKIESKADVFEDTANPQRVVRSDQLSLVGSQNPQTEMYIYTHLPPPTKVTISEVEDWDPTLGIWDRSAPSEVGWVTAPNSLAANIRNGMPIRLTYTAVARPGNRFGGDANLTNFKLSRIAHLNAHILDSFMLFDVIPWYPGTTIEKKRLVNRRLTNGEHTNKIVDTDFRSGNSLAVVDNKWVFEPKDFKIDVDGAQQNLEYNNYLQIGEDVPAFSINRNRGEESSRFLLGYMNYLFYFSTYTQDRSGRLVWCLNTSFTDVSKIVTNTFTVDFPEDLENYSRRTILARQWHDPSYLTNLAAEWNIPAANEKHIQFFHDKMDFLPASTSSLFLTVDSNGVGVAGDIDTVYEDQHTKNMRDVHQHVPSEWTTLKQFGTSTFSTLTNYFGDWTWEGTLAAVDATSDHDPLWIPCPSRDWHPYFILPPMGLPRSIGSTIGSHHYNLVQVDERNNFHSYTVASDGAIDWERDPAFSEIWQSKCNVMFHPGGSTDVRFWSSRNTESFVGDGTGSDKAESSVFDFTRQQEWLFWEEHRGFISVSEGDKLEDRGRILVQPSAGPYLTNPMTYRFLQSISIGETFGRSQSPALQAFAIEIDSGIGGIFNWNFRHEYVWESASFFPVDAVGRLRTGYVNLKYSDEVVPKTIVYDGGAWVGWKDDLPPGSLLVWQKEIGAGGVGKGEANIFKFRFPTIAIGPQNPESIRLLFSLILINSRRKTPVIGH